MKNNKLVAQGLMLLILVIFNSGSAYSPGLLTLDVYGSTQISSASLQKKFAPELTELAAIFSSEASLSSPENQKIFADLILKVNSGIKELGKFSYVNLSPILYPGDKVTHITVDLVDQNDQARLSNFLAVPTEDIPDPDHLIEQWLEYEKQGFQLVFTEKKFPSLSACSAYHCLFGFDHPSLCKYQNIFDSQVPKNKLQLVAILKRDKDEHKRAAAAYLLAHLKDGRELITILSAAINDSSQIVRNNVMRVLGATLTKVEVQDFPVEKIVAALNFPATTDRNKALFVLLALLKDKAYARPIILTAGSQLISELKLLQPNVHNLAYAILKKISGKNYSDRDYQNWEAWRQAFLQGANHVS